MTFQKALEAEKENTRSQAASAASMEALAALIAKTLDRMLYRVQEDTEEALRPVAVYLTETAKAASYFADTAGEAAIWERQGDSASGAKKKDGKRGGGVGWFLLGVSLLLFAAAVFLAAGKDAAFISSLTEKPTLILLGSGIVILFLAGWLARPVKKTQQGKEQKAQVLPDAGKCIRILTALALTMDQQMDAAREALRQEQARRERERGAVIGSEEAELFSELLAAGLSRDGDYAIDKIEDVKFYLHKKGIEAVSYTKETENWFDLIPSPGGGTIRPALVKDGILIRKGVAAGGL